MKRHIAIALVLVIFVFKSFDAAKWRGTSILKWDASSYYLYLPAVFIYNDIGHLGFYAYVDSVYEPTGKGRNYAIYRSPSTLRRFNKYTVGTAIGELPLFLLAHLYTSTVQYKYPTDGFSLPYQIAIQISTILWAIIGLWMLGILLGKYFSDANVAMTILIIGLGTNLYCYTWFEAGTSHTLVFMLFTFILYFTEQWYAAPKTKYAVGLGVFLGWVLIVRPVDFLIVFIPLFWPIRDNSKTRISLWHQYKKHLLLITLLIITIAGIQMLYWQYTTGSFIYYSYSGERFYFNDPEITHGLFYYGKGWFVYTPIAFLAFLGFIPLYNYNRKFLVPFLCFFPTIIYVVFSWWCWWYGWSFGCRALIESLAVLSIPLAALLQWISKRGVIIKCLGIVTLTFCVWLNLYQTEQYKVGVLPGDGITKEYYWRVWNRMHVDEKDRALLRK